MTMKWRWKWRYFAVAAVVVFAVVGFVPIQFSGEANTSVRTEPLDLSEFSAEPPDQKMRLLFIHHSCGGQWMARPGEEIVIDACIYESSPNGGGLRDRLEAIGYEVHEASYDSKIGEMTDIFDWPPKFRDQMQDILRCDRQDSLYQDGERNEIVMFKSCFPNNLFVGPGRALGNADGPKLTVENAKAAYRALLPEFAKHPDTLFVAVTAPPLFERSTSLIKWTAKKLLGKADCQTSGLHARVFNNWLSDATTGWLSEYEGSNVVVFDLYDVLTDSGASNFSQYPSGPGRDDDHPSSEGYKKATELFVPFLNRAVRRAGVAGK